MSLSLSCRSLITSTQRFAAACASSVALAVAATLLPLPCVAGALTDAEATKPSSSGGAATAQPSAPDAKGNKSKVAGKPDDVKDAASSASDRSGLSDTDLAKRIILGCRARPELCQKQREGERDGADVKPPRDPPPDNGPHE
jgi:hypothetical protein